MIVGVPGHAGNLVASFPHICETIDRICLRGTALPLSDDEQRILSEIEANLYETDPDLAEEVRDTTVFRHGFRNMRRAALGFLGGVLLMIFLLSTSWWLSFIGFLIMLGCALWFERAARRVGKAGFQAISRKPWKEGVGSASQRMRDRFNRERGP